MGIISLLIKAFLLYIFFNFLMTLWRVFKTFKLLKNQGQQTQDFFRQAGGGQSYGGSQQHDHGYQSNQSAPKGDVFDAEYRVVNEEN